MITISLCMIVKNEEAVLSRVLESMKNVADEIIVVDTGSTDKTKEIAKKYTNLVFDFKWIQDFSAARNFACQRASMDYWMWLDADDLVSEKSQKELLKLKGTLDKSVDMVMMKYVTGFDNKGKPTFSFYRERLIKNGCGYRWEGKVHETVTPQGNVISLPIEIEHRKARRGNPDRNINIYENMLKRGEVLEARHKYYYARELYYHERYKEAADIFINFIDEPEGWVENKIDACMQLSYCYEKLNMEKERVAILFYSFTFDNPRAEICCEIGKIMIKRQAYNQAVFWYKQALNSKLNEDSGGFIQRDCYDYIPYIQLCVCYDKLGLYDEAFKYHKLSMAVKPDDEAVKFNQKYFKNLLK